MVEVMFFSVISDLHLSE